MNCFWRLAIGLFSIGLGASRACVLRLLHAATGIDVVTIMAGRGYAALSEQFTHFGTLQFDGGKIDNPTGLLANTKTSIDSAASQLRTPALLPFFLVPVNCIARPL